VKSLVHHLTANLVKHLSSIFTQLRKRIVQRSIAAPLERELHWPVRQGREEGVNLVNETIAQPPASVGVEVEAHKHLILD
jgi:hypothetical protein